MKEEGLDIPEGVEFKCVETTDKQMWMVLPPRPAEGEGCAEEGEERIAAMCW